MTDDITVLVNCTPFVFAAVQRSCVFVRSCDGTVQVLVVYILITFTPNTVGARSKM